MNFFLFNKSLRINDNTTLIEQTIIEHDIIPIFIFTEQVNQKKNKYFSHNSVQFMCESLHELAEEIYNKHGKLYFFHSDKLIKVFKSFTNINSIGTNFDYSPYAKERQEILKQFCDKYKIKFYLKEDHVLYNILEDGILKQDGMPYTVYTPFKNHCLKNLNIKEPNKFKNFNFIKNNELEKNKFYIDLKNINNFYEYNEFANVKGGRNNALKILKHLDQFKDYTEDRNFLNYNTTFLSAANHFGIISIREVYHAMEIYKLNGLIEQLIWRDFYYGLNYFFPHMLNGQLKNNINKTYKPKFNKIKWDNNEELFIKWKTGTLGIPICDAGLRQLNKTGFMHNRLRMITANVLTKLLLIDWKLGEKYFAQNLIDYDCIQNNAGWNWISGGIDPQNVFRIFSPEIQNKKFDKECIFIKKYIPELIDVPPNDIINWNTKYLNYSHINYPPPGIDYKKARLKADKEFKKVNN